jgi:hypothetical protein
MPFQTQAQWGRFDRVLLPGEYEIVINATGYQPLQSGPVKIVTGQPLEKIFRLEPLISK